MEHGDKNHPHVQECITPSGRRDGAVWGSVVHGGQLGVYVSEGIDSSLNISLVLGIKVNLKDTLSIKLTTSTLSGDLGGVYNIIKDNDAWCPQCYGNVLMTLDECKDVAISKGGECLSTEYVNSQTKMKWKCSEGHVW